MWQTTVEILMPGRSQRHRLSQAGRPLHYRDVLNLWQHDGDFSQFFTAQLADIPYRAYFWETPPAIAATSEQPFEFVVTASEALTRLEPDPAPFQCHFVAGEAIAQFPNLGGDAQLIAPSPQGDRAAYPHLAAFCQQAPAEQQQALWQQAGRAVTAALGKKPLWLSTSGLGVAWLHLRLDSRPKYYTHAPYRNVLS